MSAYRFDKVTAIHGTQDYDNGPCTGYMVRDMTDSGRALGYVARAAGPHGGWQAVRPARFGDFIGFHRERHNLTGCHRTRERAADHLRHLADKDDPAFIAQRELDHSPEVVG